MAEITLSTGKIIKTRELTAFDSFLISSFLTGSMSEEAAESKSIPASVAFQMGQLNAIFSVEQVNGKEIKKPTNQKTLLQAFANFTGKEFDEFQRKLSEVESEEKKKENANTGENSNGSLNASKSEDGAKEQ
ncbi:hypothetical protein SAMN04489735_10453 [Aneurinibacillus thermoaerophilus]|uniref:Uncharacterized protein n=1 Tax=Aneurinibacillus thermoaerophilus TaxID=143495 RepID=A0A1G8EJU1_ANETH|nr:hypothetical protein [Aneurinibacillus thermoaerophilus]QYY44783.1 hypothetical protein K3F53_18790 [Aneurinibacillus thermoaerophilus]SDH70158.1 hypothetical protein SAMN04489735_10453 [Aneurinibacillus thermoaerophilus]